MTSTRNDEPQFHFFEQLPCELQQLIASKLSDKADLFHLAVADRMQLRWQRHEMMRRFMTNHQVVKIAGSSSCSYFLTAEGFLYVCGENPDGYLGVGDKLSRPYPVRVLGLSGVKKVILYSNRHVNDFRLFALTEAGEVWASGKNMNGELFLGHSDECLRPQRIKSLPFIIDMQKKDSSFHFLAQNGEVYVAGKNDHGQLGVDSRFLAVPEAVPGLANIIQMTIGSHMAIYVNHLGEGFALGANGFGQLALRDQERRGMPEKIGGLPPIKKVWSNDVVTFIRTATQAAPDDVYACGKNDRGQAGIGVAGGPVVNPTLVPQLKNIKEFYFYGSKSIYALTNDGRVMSWGRNANGQLGLGDKVDRLKPTFIQGLSPIDAIEFNDRTVLFMAKDRFIKVCGKDINIFPNMGEVINSTVPIEVPSLRNIKMGWNGFGIFTFLRNDGVVCGWGDNRFHALGLADEYYPELQFIELPPVSCYIMSASPADLLHYANQGSDYYHDVCFRVVLDKLTSELTFELIKEVLPLFHRSERYRSSEILRTRFPGAGALRDGNSDIEDVYIRLLLLFHKLAGSLKFDIDQQRNFILMLQEIVNPKDERQDHRDDERERCSPAKQIVLPRRLALKRFGVFGEEVEKMPQEGLQAAAKILADHLVMPELPEKRKAENDLEDVLEDDDERLFKKAKL